jgi:CheY-like chemotaxis protein
MNMIRVLLVEPHADTRELYVLGLTEAGYELVNDDDAASATIAFASHAPTIVVSETRLPGQDAADLSAQFSDAGVPVIAFTTAALYQHPASRKVSIVAVLLKPCLPDEVATAIRQALSLPRT